MPAARKGLTRCCHRPPCVYTTIASNALIPIPQVQGASELTLNAKRGRSLKALWFSDSVWNPLELVLENFGFEDFGASKARHHKMGKGSSGATFCEILIAVLLPPLGVFFKYGCGLEFWICLLLTILGYIPGILYALYVLVA